jgi:hypothetical protein
MVVLLLMKGFPVTTISIVWYDGSKASPLNETLLDPLPNPDNGLGAS